MSHRLEASAVRPLWTSVVGNIGLGADAGPCQDQKPAPGLRDEIDDLKKGEIVGIPATGEGAQTEEQAKEGCR